MDGKPSTIVTRAHQRGILLYVHKAEPSPGSDGKSKKDKGQQKEPAEPKPSFEITTMKRGRAKEAQGDEAVWEYVCMY